MIRHEAILNSSYVTERSLHLSKERNEKLVELFHPQRAMTLVNKDGNDWNRFQPIKKEREKKRKEKKIEAFVWLNLIKTDCELLF
jgi:hypothetical protein